LMLMGTMLRSKRSGRHGLVVRARDEAADALEVGQARGDRKRATPSPLLTVFLATALLSFSLLLSSAAQAQEPTSAYDYSRTSSFGYELGSGLLISETIEPDNGASCLQTVYTLDAYGNRETATRQNCGGASGTAIFTSRTSTNKFLAHSTTTSGLNLTVPAGLAAREGRNALQHPEVRSIDPRFGAVASITGPNNLTTTWTRDDFGRVILEERADGTRTLTRYCILSGLDLDTSANSADCATPAAAEVPPDAVQYVHREERNSTQGKISPYVRVYTDRLGRTLRTATEGFDGRVVVQDSRYSVNGPLEVASRPYFLGGGTGSASGSGGQGMVLNEYDVLGRVKATYRADPRGSQNTYFGPAFGSRTAAVTRMAYSGLTQIVTDAQGFSRKTETNLSGQVVRTTDPLGAQLVHQHDAFGNLVATKDALNNRTQMQVDLRGRKRQLRDPDTGTVDYDYNALGELVWQRNAKQLAEGLGATTFAYDTLGRMRTRVEPEFTSQWTYDNCANGVGRLCSTSTTGAMQQRRFAYDDKGRPIGEMQNTLGTEMGSGIGWDANGRMASRTYPSGLRVNYNYTGLGYLQSMSLGSGLTVNPLPATVGGTPAGQVNLGAGTVLWQALSRDATGALEQQRLGSATAGLVTKRTFEEATGRVTQMITGNSAGSSEVHSLSLTWDSLDRLKQRDTIDPASAAVVSDSYGQDALGRMSSHSVKRAGVALRSVTMVYNPLGNILSKSDVGAYSYPASDVNSVRPHAVSVVQGTGRTNYSYDANGNLTTASAGSYNNISYNSFNQPDENNGASGPANAGTNYYWSYDERHARVFEQRAVAAGPSAGTRETTFMHPNNAGALGFESQIDIPNAPSAAYPAGSQQRHYLSVEGQSIGVIVSTGALPGLPANTVSPTPVLALVANKLEFWHTDHLGSVVATTDWARNVTARYAYDPYGKRRQTNGGSDPANYLQADWNGATNNGTDRGFTGHDHLDDIGIVHMNGRLFDPKLGRFMQADPFINQPMDLQSFDRYGYCAGDPLNCVDPSGYISRGQFKSYIDIQTLGISRILSRSKFGRAVGSIIIAAGATYAGYYCGPECAAGINAAGQAAWAGYNGATAREAAKVGAIAGATSYALSQIGTEYPYQTQPLANTLGHAVVGCLGAEASGTSNCSQGALAGGVSAGFNNYVGYSENPILGTMQSSFVGGVASVAGGGKFAEGAQTGAFGHLFNHLGPGHQHTEGSTGSGQSFMEGVWENAVTLFSPRAPDAIQIEVSWYSGSTNLILSRDLDLFFSWGTTKAYPFGFGVGGSLTLQYIDGGRRLDPSTRRDIIGGPSVGVAACVSIVCVGRQWSPTQNGPVGTTSLGVGTPGYSATVGNSTLLGNLSNRKCTTPYRC
jgi:RHS repeat-associated protein